MKRVYWLVLMGVVIGATALFTQLPHSRNMATSIAEIEDAEVAFFAAGCFWCV